MFGVNVERCNGRSFYRVICAHREHEYRRLRSWLLGMDLVYFIEASPNTIDYASADYTNDDARALLFVFRRRVDEITFRLTYAKDLSTTDISRWAAHIRSFGRAYWDQDPWEKDVEFITDKVELRHWNPRKRAKFRRKYGESFSY